MNWRQVLRAVTPPVVKDLWRRAIGRGIQFRGRYDDWNEANQAAHGYDSAETIRKVSEATRAVIEGKAAAERDSIVFPRVPYPYPLISLLLRAGCENGGQLTVLDFGGALGSSYFQCRDFLGGLRRVNWNIVEQQAFVDVGRLEFERGPIRFFESIDLAAKAGQPDVVVLSSVLQYIPDPADVLAAIGQLQPRYVMIDRTPIAITGRQIITVQRVPREIHETSYPAWLFSETFLTSGLGPKYRLVADFDAVDGVLGIGNLSARFRGYVFDLAGDGLG
jgi:putative methyltransferase (TIGR04325 family)